MARKSNPPQGPAAWPARSRRGLLAGAARWERSRRAPWRVPRPARPQPETIAGEITSAEIKTVLLYDGPSGFTGDGVLMGTAAPLGAISAEFTAGVAGIAGQVPAPER